MSMRMILSDCADLFESKEVSWTQGTFARGLYRKDSPDDVTKPLPKVREVCPWSQDIYRLDGASIVGLICFILKQDINGDMVKLAIAQCTEVLQQQFPEVVYLETWNDAPATTVDNVIDLLRRAALASNT